jgi:conjugative transfer pilus assembly protein TraH
MGYEISGVPCNHENQAGTSDTTTSSPNATLTTVSCTGAPTLTLKDLIEGGGPGSWNPSNPLLVYTCLNPNGSTSLPPGGFDPQMCTQMQTTTLNYPGIRAYVYTMLFGVPDPQDGITADSIVGALNAPGSATFSTAQAQYLNTIGIPLVPLLSKTSDPTIRVSIARRLAEDVISCSTAAVGHSIWRAAITTQTGSGNGLSEATKANLNKLRDDTQHYETECLDAHRVMDVATGLESALHLQAVNSR